ncbi:bifunctional DNA primase/polymerase [Streptomyces sp. NPDC012623]|uniref:bifunctional DNA primase/polymerase n=1 Tax=unclassified Streptomyces TaxID=2593676 RepID=UPI00367AC9BA
MDAVAIPEQRGTLLLDSALRYAQERRWDVFPGTWLESAGGGEWCSCGLPACAAPGAHAAGPDWAALATGSAVSVRAMWTERPRASVLLPTGRSFDVLEVPETAGFLALARMERLKLTLGPVTRTPGRRMQFFVLPGAAGEMERLVRQLGWTPSAMDLVVRGEGQYVAAPPTRVGRGAVQWARRPTPADRWLPDVAELIAPLAYACGQEGSTERARRT